jgi:Flp pilus assembly protein TadG
MLQRGQSIIELAVALPILAVIAAAAIGLGPLVMMHIAVQQASYDCALAAAQSLDDSQGYQQGLAAAEASFRNFNVTPARASIYVNGNWERGGDVVCAVRYQVPVDAFPFQRLIALPDALQYSVYLPTQALKSEWR